MTKMNRARRAQPYARAAARPTNDRYDEHEAAMESDDDHAQAIASAVTERAARAATRRDGAATEAANRGNHGRGPASTPRGARYHEYPSATRRLVLDDSEMKDSDEEMDERPRLATTDAGGYARPRLGALDSPVSFALEREQQGVASPSGAISPAYPAYSPTSPAYSPSSNVQDDEGDVATAPSGIVYSPNSPAYSPTSPAYSPSSNLDDGEGDVAVDRRNLARNEERDPTRRLAFGEQRQVPHGQAQGARVAPPPQAARQAAPLAETSDHEHRKRKQHKRRHDQGEESVERRKRGRVADALPLAPPPQASTAAPMSPFPPMVFHHVGTQRIVFKSTPQDATRHQGNLPN